MSSMTDSLLPYYMLPMSPWISGSLVHIMSIISPYRIAPSGHLVQDMSTGKIFLALLGVLTFVLIIFLVLRSARVRTIRLKP